MIGPINRATRSLWLAAATACVVSAPTAAHAEAPRVGQEAPLFSLPSTEGGELSLESQRGRSAVILVFYRGSW